MTTIAAIPSTRGGARGRTQGSCRPFTSSVSIFPENRQDSCWMEMDDTALMATRKTKFCPDAMPPSVPPAWFVLLNSTGTGSEEETAPAAAGDGTCAASEGSLATNKSLCSDPLMDTPANPSPNSKPFVAGRESIALAISASNLSKQGSPTPMGMLETAVVRMPPVESWASLSSPMCAAIRAAVGGCGHLVWTTFRSFSASFSPPLADADAFGRGSPVLLQYETPFTSL
mmetsp:Transcript_20155/g.40447  ORF Transcript_20155/g.40447 Transcript_20155/m.40447 type:complete len:229 (-) Transcript_20155:719-1405(-)